MTIDEYWKIYNRCPQCRNYTLQGHLCDGCKWLIPIPSDDILFDKFEPTKDCIDSMNWWYSTFEEEQNDIPLTIQEAIGGVEDMPTVIEGSEK